MFWNKTCEKYTHCCFALLFYCLAIQHVCIYISHQLGGWIMEVDLLLFFLAKKNLDPGRNSGIRWWWCWCNDDNNDDDVGGCFILDYDDDTFIQSMQPKSSSGNNNNVSLSLLFLAALISRLKKNFNLVWWVCAVQCSKKNSSKALLRSPFFIDGYYSDVMMIVQVVTEPLLVLKAVPESII